MHAARTISGTDKSIQYKQELQKDLMMLLLETALVRDRRAVTSRRTCGGIPLTSTS